MISSKEITPLNPIQDKASSLWDAENLIPCCPILPSNIVDFIKSLGRPIKLKAIARWDLPHLKNIQGNISNAGYKLIQNSSEEEDSSDEIIKKEIIANLRETLNLSYLILITSDGGYLNILEMVPDTEIILICNPFITSSDYEGTGIKIIPYFTLCNCEIACALLFKWRLRTDLDNVLLELFKKYYDEDHVINTLSVIGRKIRETLRPIIGELDWSESKFKKMKDISEELSLNVN
ncbi:MAG: NYN domain-containing protein [Candidatus Heimdallarchaeota archaeon]|nr:NYN domain-containing protein [Candidatus Heimdallarchaeota archaeon]